MWLIFDSCEFRSDLTSAKGNNYSAYILSGMKKGFKDAADEPWSKQFFDGTVVKVRQGTNEFEMHLNEFFAECQPGDIIDIKQEKAGAELWNWKITEVENKTRSISGNIVQSSTGGSAEVPSDIKALLNAGFRVIGMVASGLFAHDWADMNDFEIEEAIAAEIDKRVNPNLPDQSI